MTLKYVGTRQYDHRIAEFSYNEQEYERFMRIAEALEDEGWKIDTGVEFWAVIAVEDRSEFEEVKKDFQRIRKAIK